MSIELIKAVVNYLFTSLMFLLLFTYGPIDLETPENYSKHKDLLIVLFCLFWPLMIIILINTIRNRNKKGD